MRSIQIGTLIAVSAFVAACSSSSGSGGSGDASASSSSSSGGDGSSESDAAGGSSSSSGSSSGGTSGTTKVICYHATSTTPNCVIAEVPSGEAALEEKDCTTTGSHPGTVVTACPTQGLTGCCTIGAEETCYYMGGASDNGCTGAGAVWTLTP